MPIRKNAPFLILSMCEIATKTQGRSQSLCHFYSSMGLKLGVFGFFKITVVLSGAYTSCIYCRLSIKCRLQCVCFCICRWDLPCRSICGNRTRRSQVIVFWCPLYFSSEAELPQKIHWAWPKAITLNFTKWHVLKKMKCSCLMNSQMMVKCSFR